MKKDLLIVATLLTSLLIYQNCAQHDFSKPASDNESITAENTTTEKLNVVDIIEGIQFNNDSSRSAISGVSQFVLDYESGTIATIDENENLISDQAYCLSDSDLQELSTIIESAMICQPPEVDRSDKVCAQIYTYPYAILITRAGDFKLGEKSDSCALPFSLCGQQDEMLKVFINNLLVSLKNKTCEP